MYCVGGRPGFGYCPIGLDLAAWCVDVARSRWVRYSVLLLVDRYARYE